MDNHAVKFLRTTASANAASFLQYGIHQLDSSHAVVGNGVCPICYDTYTESVRVIEIIACHHHFCADCLAAHVHAHRRNRNSCPLCCTQLFTRDVYPEDVVTLLKGVASRKNGVQAAFDGLCDQSDAHVRIESRYHAAFNRFATWEESIDFLNSYYDSNNEEILTNEWSGSEDEYVEDDEEEDDEESGEDHEDEDGSEVEVSGSEDAMDTEEDAWTDWDPDEAKEGSLPPPTLQDRQENRSARSHANRRRIIYDDEDRPRNPRNGQLACENTASQNILSELSVIRRQLTALDARIAQIQGKIWNNDRISYWQPVDTQAEQGEAEQSMTREFLALQARVDALEAGLQAHRPAGAVSILSGAVLTNVHHRRPNNGRDGLDEEAEAESDHVFEHKPSEEYHVLMDIVADNEGDDELSDDDMDKIFI